MEGKGNIVGTRSPDFGLADANGETVTLKELCTKGPVLLAFYPGDFTMVCTKQLCNYRDSFPAFQALGVQIVGISHNKPTDHRKFQDKYAFPFKLLTDPGREVAKRFGCASAWMLGGTSRAVFLVNSKQITLYRYVEPTVLSHRGSGELLAIAQDLKKAGLLV